MKEIKLKCGNILKMDDDTYTFLKDKYIQIDAQGYPFLYLHRMFFEETNIRLVSDHANGDKLDFRRKNLRLASKAQNAVNRTKRKEIGSSKYYGVSWSTGDKKWVVRIATLEKDKYITKFSAHLDNEDEAARVYGIGAIALWGLDFVTTNFSKTLYKGINCAKEAKRYVPQKMINKTGYRGVAQRSKNSYRATHHDKILGNFKNPEDAARAYDKELIKQNRNLDKLNFPLGNPEETVK